MPASASALDKPGAAAYRRITFPVVGAVHYSDTFGACRDGCRRRHEGIDLMGAKLQHEVAAVDGRVTSARADAGGRSGNTLTIEDADGWSYVYRHINNDTRGSDDDANPARWRFAPRIAPGVRVRAGEFVAYMGDSGNAESTAAHLHFEVREPDGTAVDPYESLRRAQLRHAGTQCDDAPIAAAPAAPAAAVAAVRAGNDGPVPAAPARPMIAMAPTPSGQGYWLADDAGRVTAYGDARNVGDATALDLDQPIVDITPTATGRGYWLLARDGGIFSYGDAHYYGSSAEEHVPVPIVDMTTTPGGQGYWLLGADGQVFAFGNAGFFGTTACTDAGAGNDRASAETGN
jgi:hypothetical protein